MDAVPVYALVENCALNSSYKLKKSTSTGDSQSVSKISTEETNDVDIGVKHPTKYDRESLDETLIYEEKRSRLPHFHVTYWMFYPFSEGKTICVLDLGYLGSWPIPLIGGKCFGDFKQYGSHVGDWEHMSLYFKVCVCPGYWNLVILRFIHVSFFNYRATVIPWRCTSRPTTPGLFIVTTKRTKPLSTRVKRPGREYSRNRYSQIVFTPRVVPTRFFSAPRDPTGFGQHRVNTSSLDSLDSMTRAVLDRPGRLGGRFKCFREKTRRRYRRGWVSKADGETRRPIVTLWLNWVLIFANSLTGPPGFP